MAWDISYFTAAVSAGSGNGVPAGIFIPQADLPGILQASELADSNKEAKVAYALASKIQTILSALTNKLGLSNSRSMSTGAVLDRITVSFLLTCQFVVNHSTNVLSVLPVDSAQVGNVALSDLFPGHDVVAAEGAIPGAGIVVPTATIAAFGGTLPGSGSADARDWLVALYYSMVQSLTVSEAVISASRGSATGLTPAANFTGVNAITSLDADDLPLLSFFSVTYSVTLQIALNQATQTFDLAA